MCNARIENIYQDGACYTVFLDSKAKEPLFCDVVKNKCGKPITDGKCVCWSNGATLSLQDMLDMLQTGKQANFSASRV